ncbi:MAG TPA: 2Fe-2S iron-sulfur cluster-binding protein [Pyrinomonadaceae bacterium]|nr:(2Fe-2S)-binding protein [Chloracidobacterium sp.]MBP9935173.1 (2Fe-2S)-binding protein [Pyrinomonadaceae bacterium]MBK7803399.1 (2Fe-2S)-binding protein [Chloracidobacterium sp.]MBK9438650.1 (2Fe-2S)-binding protein [Chloracidobacterium sp.]MBK9766706.1 (2Fe-2S)-binding protein [Chloracidobacterium sp.]
MPHIIAETATGTISFEAIVGQKLVLALEDNGVDILHRCGGNARCTTCRVELIVGDAGEMGPNEQAILSTKEGLNENTRLSCQIRVNGDMEVKVINQASVAGIEPGTRPED